MPLLVTLVARVTRKKVFQTMVLDEESGNAFEIARGRLADAMDHERPRDEQDVEVSVIGEWSETHEGGRRSMTEAENALEEATREAVERSERKLFQEIWEEGFLEWSIRTRLALDVSPSVGTRMSRNVGFSDFLAWRRQKEAR